MIDLINVTKTYPNGKQALKNIDLKIDEGEFVFVVGPNGSGKTTLSKILMREERVTSGKIKVSNYDLARLPDRKVPYLRRTIGVVFQDFRLFPEMTVFENVAFAMHVIGESGRVIKKRVAKFLNLLELADKADLFPRQLSGGEQQRVALARALVNNPKIVIADEPTGNIDPIMSIELMEILMKINTLGKTVIVITHAKNLVDYYQKRVITLNDGSITSDRTGGMFNEN